ncbi:hypothetical protein GCM10010149_91390 [Nonomuraea roseoviolacea subsp. roseoviolacea]
MEVAGGRPFGAFMRERVLGPLGMRSSAVSEREVRPADGYNSVYGLWLSRPELPAFLDGSGSGGVITTAADMGRWLIAQNGRGRRLVGPASLAAMHAPSKVSDYGMGWGLDDRTRRLTHSGNLFTYTAVETIVPETGYGFAVMANSASLTDETFTIAAGLADLSEGRPSETPGGDRQLFELVLGLIALVAAGLGVLGAARSRRWAARRLATTTPKNGFKGSAQARGSRRTWRVGLRLVPVLLPSALLAAYPELVSFLSNGRTITWAQLTYFPAPLTITLVVAAAAGLTTAAFRVVRYRALSRARLATTR